MKRILPITLALLSCAVLASVSAAEKRTRFHQYTDQFADPDNAATVVSSGYLGGTGSEYLTGVGFASNGTVVVTGYTYGGGDLKLGNARITVLGPDSGSAPEFTMPMGGKKRNNPQPPDWRHLTGAGFIAVMKNTGGTMSVSKGYRLPWGAGSINDVVGVGDSFIVSGLVGANFASVPGKRLGSESNPTMFIAALGSNGFDWILPLADEVLAPPALTLLQDGTLSVVAGHGWHIDPANGSVKHYQKIPVTKNWARAVNPIDFSHSTGSDRNTKTGWEPWRAPVFMMAQPDGQHLYQPYQWASRVVGMNFNRLVSDSSIRPAGYDLYGNLLVSGWSDGGNSVLAHHPFDLLTDVVPYIKASTGRDTGLPFSTWGAGVGSFNHLISLDTETGLPVSKTIYCAYLGSKNVPSALVTNYMAPTADNSLAIHGGSSYGFIETAVNRVNTMDYKQGHYIGGNYISILDSTMSNLRFASVLPGGGMVPLRRYSARHNTTVVSGSAMVNGKVMVGFVAGAKQSEFFTLNNQPQAFGGGDLDGQFVILSMDALPHGKVKHAPVPDKARQVLGDKTREKIKKEADEKKKKRKGILADAGTWKIGPIDRNYGVLMFRDATGKTFPSYHFALPEGDGHQATTNGTDARVTGSFTIVADENSTQMLSGNSAPDKMVISNIIVETKKKLDNGFEYRAFTVQPLTLAVELNGEKATATLTMGTKSVSLRGSTWARSSSPVGRGINICGSFTTTKGTLGFGDSTEKDEQVFVEFWIPARD